VRRLRGVLAQAALVALVVVPPAALVRFVGWPLPRALPDLDALGEALRSGIDDRVVVNVLACLAWVLWAQLALAAAVEIAAVVGSRDARPVAPGGIQAAMGRLVAAAMIVAAAGPSRPAPLSLVGAAPAAAVAAPAAAPLPRADAVAPAATPAPAVAPPPATSGVAASARGLTTYVAECDDSWWSLAERTLGDGRRWRELRDLNAGRRMPDGSVVDGTRTLLRSGWTIVLPAGTGQAHEVDSTDGAVEVTVAPGDNLWRLTERQLATEVGRAPTDDEVRSRWSAAIEANRDRFADPADPGLIFAGQVLRIPTAPPASPSLADAGPGTPDPTPEPAVPPAASPAAPAAEPSAVDDAPVPGVPEEAQLPDSADGDRPGLDGLSPAAGPAPSSAPAAPPAPPEPSPEKRVTTTTTARNDPPSPPSRPPRGAASNGSSPARGGAEAPVGLLGAAGTALAAGIATAVARRRHARRRRLPRGAEEPAPPTALDGLRREVLLGADVDRAALVQRALRDLAKSLAENGSEVRPRLVQVGRHGIEVLLSQPAVPAPPGWRAQASGNTWVLAGDPLPDDDGPAALPALVTIGRPEAGTELHLDLEAEGVVAIHGDADAAAALARSMVLELSTSPEAAGVSVLVVGERLHSPTGADRVRAVAVWSEVAAEAERRLEQSANLVAANRWPTPVAGRARSTHSDDLAPLVVVAEDAGDDAFARFCASVLDSRAAVAVVVVGGGPEGATVLDVEPEVLSIASLGLRCVPQSVSSEAADAVQELLDDAEHIPDQLSFLPAPAAPLHRVGDAYADPPHDVLVQLLGEIAVIGGSRRLTPQETAVVAFVALNGPVAADRIEDAVWSGGTSSRRKRLSNTLSECRAVLGSAALPLARDGRYRTGSALACDVDLFERRLAYAAGQPEAAAVMTLRGALEKVKGPVFSYRHADRASFAWVDIDNWLSRWELKVTNAAEDLAERLLALGDHDGAVWAAERGLLVAKTDERMVKLLVQAHLANGDEVAAQRVIGSHRATLESLDLDDADADLIDLYNEARHHGSAPA
jgi:nucleoid-associated protein YgaU/DNA-binding SARP family transcriptional activator